MTHIGKELTQDEWQSDLIWCPSQCYMHKRVNGVDYILYLRWRWADPWQAHIVTNAWNSDSMHNDDAEWSGDLFDELGSEFHFKDEEHEEAKVALEAIFHDLHGHNNQPTRTPGLGAFKDPAELTGLTIRDKQRKRQ